MKESEQNTNQIPMYNTIQDKARSAKNVEWFIMRERDVLKMPSLIEHDCSKR